jgi:hypothetical protein
MLNAKPKLLPWLRSAKAKQALRFVLGLGVTVARYFLWQFVALFAYFFTFGSGVGHQNGGLLVSASFLAVHVGLLSWLLRRRVLYIAWWEWAVNVGVAIALFAGYVFYPWYGSPPDPTYQLYTFAQGQRRYEITLEKPGTGTYFDLSDVTRQQTGTTTSLLMGDYRVHHDTLFLREWQGPRQCLIYRDTLIGFEPNTKPIPLSRQQ